MKNVGKHYVYALLDPRKKGTYEYERLKFDYEPFYIGKGHGSRITSHFRTKTLKSEQRKRRNPYKANKILKMMREGHEPIIKYLKQHTTDANAIHLEIKAISLIGRGRNGPLVNQTDGGEGMSGHVATEITRKLLSTSSKLFWKTISDEQREDISRKLSANNYAYWENVSAEELALRSENLSNANKRFWALLTPKERTAHRKLLSNNTKAVWDNMTKRERRAFLELRARGHACRTPEQKAETAKILSMNGKQFWASLSSSERRNHIERITEGVIRSRPKAVKSYLKTIANLTPTQRKEWRNNISSGMKEFIQNNPERRAEMDTARSAAAKARTSKQRKAIAKKFSFVQKNLPENTKKKREKKLSNALKQYHATKTEEQASSNSKALSVAVGKYWKEASLEEKARRGAAIALGYANKPQRDIDIKNGRIREAISLHHSSMSAKQKWMRSYMIMCGSLISNYCKDNTMCVDKEQLKSVLRIKGQKYQSRYPNSDPTHLRERVRTIILSNKGT